MFISVINTDIFVTLAMREKSIMKKHHFLFHAGSHNVVSKHLEKEVKIGVLYLKGCHMGTQDGFSIR